MHVGSAHQEGTGRALRNRCIVFEKPAQGLHQDIYKPFMSTAEREEPSSWTGVANNLETNIKLRRQGGRRVS